MKDGRAALLAGATMAFASFAASTAAAAVCRYEDKPAAVAASASATAPKVFSATQQAAGGDVVSLRGANFDPFAKLWLEAPGAQPLSLPILNRVGDNWLSAQVPDGVEGGLTLRVANTRGTSEARRVNAAIPYHIDATQIVPGGLLRLLGRSLIRPGCATNVRIGGLDATVDAEQSDAHMLVLRAPYDLVPDTEVRIVVDNGAGVGPSELEHPIAVRRGSNDELGLGIGWGGAFAFTHRIVKAPIQCDGTQDVAATLSATIKAASISGGAVVELPVGTCRIGTTVDMAKNIVLRGSGRETTSLVYDTNYPIHAEDLSLVGLEHLRLVNAGPVQEGMLWRRNEKSFIRDVSIEMGVSRQWFMTENRDFLFDGNIVIQTGSYDEQNPFRFDQSVGLTFSNNAIRTAVGSPTFQGVHDALFLGNRFTRDGATQNDMPIVAHHGFVMDFSSRISLIRNRFDVVNGPIDNQLRNDGETILVEGGGANRTETLGRVASATARSIADPNMRSPAPGQDSKARRGLAIVSGPGAGQTRSIVSTENGEISVDREWDILPAVGSIYSTFAWGLEKALIVGNVLVDNPRGIWLYQTSIRDIVIQDNEIVDGGGIYLRAYQNAQQGIFTVQSDVLVAGNKLSNKTGRWMSHIVIAAVSADQSTLGTAQSGFDIRRNTIVANRPNVTSTQEDYASTEGVTALLRIEPPSGQAGPSPSILGMLFQGNECVNCERPFTIGNGVAGTVFLRNVPDVHRRGTVRDLDVRGRPLGGSTATVLR